MNVLDEMADRSGTPPPPGRAQRQQRNAERAMAALNWNLERWSSALQQGRGTAGAASMAKLVLAVAPRNLPTSGKPSDLARALVADPGYHLK